LQIVGTFYLSIHLTESFVDRVIPAYATIVPFLTRDGASDGVEELGAAGVALAASQIVQS
jgi:hypothetical protein